MKLIAKTFFIFLLISCNNSTENNSEVSRSKPDSIMHEVMEQHDRGMAKMSKLSQAKNKIQHALDSISKLPANLQNSSVQYRMQLDSAFNRLNFANYAMEKWMNEFNMDTLKDNKGEQAKYLESEKEKITKVNEVMTSSLQKTGSLLNKE
jgi:cysteinyl-tRNA synthetase